MTDRIMIDTNILVYAYLSTDLDKHKKALSFLDVFYDKANPRTEIEISDVGT